MATLKMPADAAKALSVSERLLLLCVVLPVACFHVVITLPAAMANIAYQNKAAI
jgi:hypothetical protein